MQLAWPLGFQRVHVHAPESVCVDARARVCETQGKKVNTAGVCWCVCVQVRRKHVFVPVFNFSGQTLLYLRVRASVFQGCIMNLLIPLVFQTSGWVVPTCVSNENQKKKKKTHEKTKKMQSNKTIERIRRIQASAVRHKQTNTRRQKWMENS